MFTRDARSKAVTALARGSWEISAPYYLQGLPYEDLTQGDETAIRQAYRSLLRTLTQDSRVGKFEIYLFALTRLRLHE
jgi:hypothetical protein